MDIPSLPLAQFPQLRMRRLRQSNWIRRLVQENHLSSADLIWPLFVQDGSAPKEPIESMPGVFCLNIAGAVEAAKEAKALGISAVAIFPRIAEHFKDARGSYASRSDNLVCRTLSAIKDAVPDLGVMCDVALDPYTHHGHDGVLHPIQGSVDNDATLDLLCAQAMVLAHAGADMLGPSDMMDGRIGHIRRALEQHGHHHTILVAYATKFASAFYGPFRQAVGSAQKLGIDKRSYQQDPANSDECLREVALDLAEGADMVLVKPGLPYLDVVSRVRHTFQVPTLAYQVSGEYSMICAAAKQGWLDLDAAMFESALCLKRAGATAILTYAAPRLASQCS